MNKNKEIKEIAKNCSILLEQNRDSFLATCMYTNEDKDEFHKIILNDSSRINIKNIAIKNLFNYLINKKIIKIKNKDEKEEMYKVFYNNCLIKKVVHGIIIKEYYSRYSIKGGNKDE